MPISLATNLPAVKVRGHLDRVGENFSKSIERVASGKRIIRSGDDAAGLSISNSLEAKIRSIQQARRNASEAMSLIQVAEGGMNEVSNLVVRLRELAVQAASDTVGEREREMLQLEAVQIREEVDRLAEATRYFDTQLLNGTSKNFNFQIGIENTIYDRIQYDSSEVDLRSGALGVDGINLADKDGAADSLSVVDEAFKRMGTPRSKLGALQLRMTSIQNNLSTYEESLTAANSRILDADIARETTNVVQSQILQKAGMAVLAQANAAPMHIMKLVEGM